MKYTKLMEKYNLGQRDESEVVTEKEVLEAHVELIESATDTMLVLQALEKEQLHLITTTLLEGLSEEEAEAIIEVNISEMTKKRIHTVSNFFSTGFTKISVAITHVLRLQRDTEKYLNDIISLTKDSDHDTVIMSDRWYTGIAKNRLEYAVGILILTDAMYNAMKKFKTSVNPLVTFAEEIRKVLNKVVKEKGTLRTTISSFADKMTEIGKNDRVTTFSFTGTGTKSFDTRINIRSHFNTLVTGTPSMKYKDLAVLSKLLKDNGTLTLSISAKNGYVSELAKTNEAAKNIEDSNRVLQHGRILSSLISILESALVGAGEELKSAKAEIKKAIAKKEK